MDREPHPLNAPGPFYVENETCMACGAPEAQAPTIMSHASDGRCFFSRQPATPQETDAALLAISVSCCRAVRYGGNERDILVHLAEMGEAESCDHRLRDEPQPVVRNRATFAFGNQQVESAVTAATVMECLAAQFETSLYSRCEDFQISEGYASFRYRWGVGPEGLQYSIKAQLSPHGNGRWLLQAIREDSSTSTYTGQTIYMAMRKDSRFTQMQWFSDSEWHE